MQRYVAGFMFDTAGHVALVRKNKPEWQKGKLNGIGGKIEDGEKPGEAMVREFFEETGVATTLAQWYPFATLEGKGFQVCFFKGQGDLRTVRTMETEEIVRQRVSDITVYNAIPNLTWLIPLAVSTDFDHASHFTVIESN